MYFPRFKVLKRLSRYETPILVIEFLNDYEKNGKWKHSPVLLKSVIAQSISDNYISCDGNAEDTTATIEITATGREYLQAVTDRAFLFWLPYTITTVIAVAALLVSIIALR